MRVCAISVDLDEIHHYHAIHGLPAPPPDAQHLVYDIALARYRDFASAEGIPLTLFAVGADLGRAENGSLLRFLASRGHEVGNHTFDHWYDLSHRSRQEMSNQIERANDAIAAHTGQRPAGFRAPGYVMSDELYSAVAEAGMQYSSSVFPCPYYYLAKLAKLGELRLRGKRSRSISSGAQALLAPREPYRVGHPYWRPGGGVLEMPIQVTRTWRLPFFGTGLMLLGPELARQLLRHLAGLPLINLELHGIDLLDQADHLSTLARQQFDLRIALERKWQTLSAVVEEARALGYAFVRLDEAAKAFV